MYWTNPFSPRGLGRLGVAATIAAVGAIKAASSPAEAQAAGGTIKVGILHSLSGTMAISETTLKDVMLMLIEQQNKKGGCWARSWRPSWSIRLPTGRCSLKRRDN